jgi:hypothetical protein
MPRNDLGTDPPNAGKSRDEMQRFQGTGGHLFLLGSAVEDCLNAHLAVVYSRDEGTRG